MNDRPSSRQPLALAVVTLAVALAACGRVPGQFEILNDQLPQQGCAIPVAPDVYRGEGTLDVSIVRADFTSAYFFFPLIENNLPPSSGTQIDPNEIQLSGFQVDITSLAAGTVPGSIQDVLSNPMNAALTHYQVPWSGGVSSGGGQLSASVAAFPVELAQQMAAAGGIGHDPTALAQLTISALGTTNSGQHMTSDPFHFPLHLCSGCLVASTGPCATTAGGAAPGNFCNPAQDDPVGCCTENGALICPPPGASQ